MIDSITAFGLGWMSAGITGLIMYFIAIKYRQWKFKEAKKK